MFLTILGGLFFIAAESASAQNCQPNDNQIAVFAEKNFQGKCKVFDVGDYPNSEAMGFDDNSISSVKIGMYVYANLFDTDFGGDSRDHFRFDNADLAKSEVGDNKVSAIMIWEVEDLKKKMIGTWLLKDQKMIVDKEEFKVYKNGKFSYGHSYFVISDDEVAYGGAGGDESKGKLSFKDNGETMIWEDIAKNYLFEFKRVLQSPKPVTKSNESKANSASNNKPVAASDSLIKKLLGTWGNEEEELIFTEKQYASRLPDEDQPSFITSYKIIDGETIEFKNEEGDIKRAKVSFKNNGKTLVWHIDGDTINYNRR